MSSVNYGRASGVIMLTLPDGKFINMRVAGVEVVLDEEVDEIEQRTLSGSPVIRYNTTTTRIDLVGLVEGLTVTDPNPD